MQSHDENSISNETPVLDKDDRQIFEYDEIKINEEYKNATDNHKKCNYKEAWRIFNLLASVNHEKSLFYLGLYYEKGFFVDADIRKALKYYRKSADAGYNRGAYFYAEASRKIAYEYMEKALELGQFKSGIKLTEWSLPDVRALSSPKDMCEKLLSYLDADEIKLQIEKPKDLEAYKKRIKNLRDEIKQIIHTSESNSL